MGFWERSVSEKRGDGDNTTPCESTDRNRSPRKRYDRVHARALHTVDPMYSTMERASPDM